MKRFILMVLVLLSLTPLFADQAAWLTKAQAESGAKLIKTAGEIRHYCEPCGDNFYRAERVSDVKAVKAQGSEPKDSFYEVTVNGSSVDLAYVYVRVGEKWVNAAIHLKINVSRVPAVLPEDLENEIIDQNDVETNGVEPSVEGD